MSGIGQINNAGIFMSTIYGYLEAMSNIIMRIIGNLFKKITGNLWYVLNGTAIGLLAARHWAAPKCYSVNLW